VMPVSLWNVALVNQTLALDSQNGRLIPLSVIDLGEERLILKGHPMLAHHYSIKSSLAEDICADGGFGASSPIRRVVSHRPQSAVSRRSRANTDPWSAAFPKRESDHGPTAVFTDQKSRDVNRPSSACGSTMSIILGLPGAHLKDLT
jgi:hypothetical protein